MRCYYSRSDTRIFLQREMDELDAFTERLEVHVKNASGKKKGGSAATADAAAPISE